jgi:hypothetical protein
MSLLSTKKNVMLSCLITGIYDVNRNETLQNDNYLFIKDWCESILKLDLRGVIFHNNFTDQFCEKSANKHIEFIRIQYDKSFNPNVFRYLVYRDYLAKFSDEIENLFVTDISDVVVVKNPFLEPFYLENFDCIFCGDESKILENEWMEAHSEHLRSKIENYEKYEYEFKNHTLLNCGIIGGNIKVMQGFIEKLASIHQLNNHDNKTAYTGDMGAFNYLVRTQFNEKVKHGFPINTEFKGYQTNRDDCWFRHK